LSTVQKPVNKTTEERLQEELQSKKLQLHWLLQITKAINYNFSQKQLLDVYEHVLTSQLKVGKLVLFILNGTWKNLLMFGVDENFSSYTATTILNDLNAGHTIENTSALWEKTFELVTPVFHKDRPLAYGLVGSFADGDSTSGGTRKELHSFIQTITNLIVVAIENNKMAEEQIKQAAIRKELELAAQMQSLLFPPSLPCNEHYELHATYLPHQEVGGDYYDYISLSEDEFAICMADVSGKGMSAALLMANFQANLHALIRQPKDCPLTELAHQLNSRVYASAKGEKFITFFIGIYNIRSRELQYFNAGHNPPFLVHHKVVYQLTEGSTGLGMFEKLPFINVGKLLIPDGALLLCYTDGVTELENESGEAFGEERLQTFLLQNLNADTNYVHSALLDKLNDFRQTKPHLDDVTLLSCWFKH